MFFLFEIDQEPLPRIHLKLSDPTFSQMFITCFTDSRIKTERDTKTHYVKKLTTRN